MIKSTVVVFLIAFSLPPINAAEGNIPIYQPTVITNPGSYVQADTVAGLSIGRDDTGVDAQDSVGFSPKVSTNTRRLGLEVRDSSIDQSCRPIIPFDPTGFQDAPVRGLARPAW
jgi:hypothetical protein